MYRKKEPKSQWNLGNVFACVCVYAKKRVTSATQADSLVQISSVFLRFPSINNLGQNSEEKHLWVETNNSGGFVWTVNNVQKYLYAAMQVLPFPKLCRKKIPCNFSLVPRTTCWTNVKLTNCCGCELFESKFEKTHQCDVFRCMGQRVGQFCGSCMPRKERLPPSLPPQHQWVYTLIANIQNYKRGRFRKISRRPRQTELPLLLTFSGTSMCRKVPVPHFKGTRRIHTPSVVALRALPAASCRFPQGTATNQTSASHSGPQNYTRFTCLQFSRNLFETEQLENTQPR